MTMFSVATPRVGEPEMAGGGRGSGTRKIRVRARFRCGIPLRALPVLSLLPV